MAPPKPDRPIDRDERAGLVRAERFVANISKSGRLTSGQKAVRDFLRLRNCYDVLPLSFRLIELDVGLTVKESLNIMVQCGIMSHFLIDRIAVDLFGLLGIVSAPLWDSTTSTYAGLLTVNDYLNVIRYYNLHADKLKDVDKLLLSDLRGESE